MWRKTTRSRVAWNPMLHLTALIYLLLRIKKSLLPLQKYNCRVIMSIHRNNKTNVILSFVIVANCDVRRWEVYCSNLLLVATVCLLHGGKWSQKKEVLRNIHHHKWAVLHARAGWSEPNNLSPSAVESLSAGAKARSTEQTLAVELENEGWILTNRLQRSARPPLSKASYWLAQFPLSSLQALISGSSAVKGGKVEWVKRRTRRKRHGFAPCAR